MTKVLVWKVYREQRLVWLAMAVLAGCAVLLRLTLLERDLQREALGRLFCLFAYVYGLVVGAVLLAGEREAGTATFLEVLPVKRVTVWWVKCWSGLVLVLAQVVLLWLLLLDAILVDWSWGLVLLLALAGVATLGFAWGLFFSGQTKTAMGAIFAAMVGQIVAAPITIAISNALLDLMHTPPGSPVEPLSLVLCCLPVVVGLILGSGASEARRDQRPQVDDRKVCAGDFPPESDPASPELELQAARFLLDDGPSLGEQRQQPAPDVGPEDPWLTPPRQPPSAAPARPVPEPADGTGPPGWVRQLSAVFWLEMRQGGKLFLWLAGAGLVAGCLSLGVLGWPVLTLLLGVIAGVSVFAGEQVQASARFLAEQRLPLGRVWAVKVGARLVLALGVVQLMLLPAAVRVAFLQVLGARPKDPTPMHLLAPYVQMGPYLILGLVHGFSVSCLCGLFFRKPVIVGAVAVAASLLLVGLWLPSALVGGLHAWQYWGVPVLLLLTVRLLLWPWATDQLGSRRATLRLASGLTLAVLWFVGALTYRVIEVPLVEDRLDLAGFERSLEAARKTETGFRLRTIVNGVTTLQEKEWRGKWDRPQRWRIGWDELQSLNIPSEGWWKHERETPSSWLDAFYRCPWPDKLAETVRRPLGVVEDVQSRFPGDRTTATFRNQDAEVVQVLVARGLQLQARGDPAVFLEHLETGLALIRQLRHLAPAPLYPIAEPAERDLLRGVERWLERLHGRPDLLRRALELLRRHEQATAEEADNAYRADYLIAMNAVRRPESWACQVVRGQHAEGDLLAALMATAWQTPWEQARLQRLIRQLANEGGVACPLPSLLSRKVLFPGYHSWNTYAPFKDTTTPVQARKVMVALRLFQAEAGRPARNLEELTPNILPSVPIDPGTGEPIDYWLSDGKENPDWPEELPLPPGQALLTFKSEMFLVPLPQVILKPYDVLQVTVAEGLPNDPIGGPYFVDADGTLDLDERYGSVLVKGLTLEEACTAVMSQLAKKLKNPAASIRPAGHVSGWRNVSEPRQPHRVVGGQELTILVSGTWSWAPIYGSYKVNADNGEIDLGAKYGKVSVKGLTVRAATLAIREQLRESLNEPVVKVFPGRWDKITKSK